MQLKDAGKLAYQDQLKFNQMFFKDRGVELEKLTPKEINSQFKEFVLNIVRESTEALNTRKFKMHRVEHKEEILSNTIEELMDVQKFLWGTFQLMGVTWEEFLEMYWAKSKVVEQRYFQEHKLKETAKGKAVAVFDMDGILCKYPDHWLEYASGQLGKTFTSHEELKYSVDLTTYENLKSAYRQSGLKQNIPMQDNASTVTHALKDAGYHIVIISSRPYKKYFRIFSDTIKWLDQNDIAYDALMFDDQKNIRIVNEVPHLSFMVEDDARYANSVAELGYKVYFMGIESERKMLSTKVTQINSLLEILESEKIGKDLPGIATKV